MDPDIALGASIMGQVQWSTRPDAAEFEVAVMDRFGVTTRAHFLETYEAIEHQQTKFQLYKNAGALRPGMMFGHFIQTTPEIIADAAAGGASMSWQPASNGRLASGIAHVPEMLETGDEGRHGARRPGLHRRRRPVAEHAHGEFSCSVPVPTTRFR